MPYTTLAPSFGAAKRIPASHQCHALRIEPMEDRVVLSNFFVVPIGEPIDSNHRYSLSEVLTLVGSSDVIVIQPGAAPATVPLFISVDNVTIQGAPSSSPGSLPLFDLNVNSDFVTLSGLNLGTVTMGGTADHATITSSNLVSFIETSAMSGVGGNVLRGNHITGSINLGGNSGLFQPTTDIVEDNTIVTNQPVAIMLTNSNSSTIQNNEILSGAGSGVGIQIRSNSDNVLISGNTVNMIGTGQPFGVVLINTGGAAGNILGAKVVNNTVAAGANGTGVLINIFGTGTGMVGQLEGNDLTANKVGVDVNGLPGGTGAGNIDLGGGSTVFGTSRGGNNFRGFDGVDGRFAIYLHNTDANIPLTARFNIFTDGANLGTVVRDQNNAGGSGIINTSNALGPDEAFVQSLYRETLGRLADPASGGELDQATDLLQSKGQRAVAKKILYSDESLGLVVDDIYDDLLNRDATDAEELKLIKQLRGGKSVAAIQAKILGSVEYQAQISSDFVQAVYQDLLNRPAAPEELTKAYKSIKVRGLQGVAAAVAGSAERRAEVVSEVFQDLLHRDATADELTKFSKMAKNRLRFELSILSSDEFFAQG